MKILFTGGSSFTGCWFIRELAQAGHEVMATFRQANQNYPDELRSQRVAMSLEYARGVFNCSFGDKTFRKVLRDEQFDLLCHHAADVTNYRSERFDVGTAVANNTRNIGAVIDALGENAKGMVLTGSVFENDEGAGEEDLRAFSPYGLSKGMTHQICRYHACNAGIDYGKFVIPNPFGPLEEPRFTAYLMKNWFAGETPSVNTPDYVRDNIHVSLLALAYRGYVEQVASGKAPARINPSGYVETQGKFAERFADAMRARLNLPCALELARQTDFAEPLKRFNTEPVDGDALGWDESAAWDEIAAYYAARLGAAA